MIHFVGDNVDKDPPCRGTTLARIRLAWDNFDKESPCLWEHWHGSALSVTTLFLNVQMYRCRGPEQGSKLPFDNIGSTRPERESHKNWTRQRPFDNTSPCGRRPIWINQMCKRLLEKCQTVVTFGHYFQGWKSLLSDNVGRLLPMPKRGAWR